MKILNIYVHIPKDSISLIKAQCFSQPPKYCFSLSYQIRTKY